MTDWQLIDKIPEEIKQGEIEVLLFQSNGRSIIGEFNKWSREWIAPSPSLRLTIYPTHWQPLPPPPKP